MANADMNIAILKVKKFNQLFLKWKVIPVHPMFQASCGEFSFPAY